MLVFIGEMPHLNTKLTNAVSYGAENHLSIVTSETLQSCYNLLTKTERCEMFHQKYLIMQPLLDSLLNICVFLTE